MKYDNIVNQDKVVVSYSGTPDAGQVTPKAPIPPGLELRIKDDEGFTKIPSKNQKKKLKKASQGNAISF